MPPYDMPCAISSGLFLFMYHKLHNSHSNPANRKDPDAFWSDIMKVVAKPQLASATSLVSQRPSLRTVRMAIPAVSFSSAMVRQLR